MGKKNNFSEEFMFIYAMGNIKGYYDLFEEAVSLVDLSGDNKLVFVGEYTRIGPDSLKILDRMMALEAEYGSEKVIVLRGNEEQQTLLGEVIPTSFDNDYVGQDSKYSNWFKTLKQNYIYGGYEFIIPGKSEDTVKEMTEYSKSIYREQINKEFNDEEYCKWLGSLGSVYSYHPLMGHGEDNQYTYDVENFNAYCLSGDTGQDLAEEFFFVPLDEFENRCKTGTADPHMTQLVEQDFKRPQVIKIDPDKEYNCTLRFWKKPNGEYIERWFNFHFGNFYQLGLRKTAYKPDVMPIGFNCSE
jgi:hypothetical protein